MSAHGKTRKASWKGLSLCLAMLFCPVCLSAAEQSASPQQGSNQLFQELHKMEQQPPQGKEPAAQPPAIASHYPADQYLIGTGQGDLSKGRLVCRRASELAARAELAKQIRVWVKEHAVDRVRERTAAPTEQDIEVVREETVNELLQNVKIVDQRVDEAAGTCTSVAVMPKRRVTPQPTTSPPETPRTPLAQLPAPRFGLRRGPPPLPPDGH